MAVQDSTSGPAQSAAVAPERPRGGRGAAREGGSDSARRRRRANASGPPRQAVQQLRLTEAELGRLRERAAALGMSVPRLLVESAMAGSGTAGHEAGGAFGGVLGGTETVTERRRLMTELMAAHRTLAGAAVNMNQVARKANTTHELPSDFEAVFEELRRLGGKLESVVDQLIEANRRDGLEVPRR